MTLPNLLRGIATHYRSLPDLLEPGKTGPVDLTGIRTPSPIHSPAPINVDVADLMRVIEQAALSWEWELTRSFWLPAPYWTRPVAQSVPLSLEWSAGIIERPPEAHADGYWMPGVVPDMVAAWITAGALEVEGACSRLFAPPPRPRRAPEPCPRCSNATLMGRTGDDVLRCVTAGCGYTHRSVA